MAELVFFASIRENLGCDRLSIELPDKSTVVELIETLAETRGEAWREALSADNVRIAVNQELITGNAVIDNGDEIAFFPPVTGG